MLKLLASQAAIRLENAHLYRVLEERETKIRKAQTELAHVTRVATMGELTASIAHEINQPLGAIANNAQAGLRFLATGSENLQLGIVLLNAAVPDNAVLHIGSEGGGKIATGYPNNSEIVWQETGLAQVI